MGYKFLLVTALSLVMCGMAGCAPSHTVVLVADPAGHVGTAEVATPAGKRLLDKSNDMTRVSGPSSLPAPVATADPAYITATFSDVLAIEPPPAEKFILLFETNKTRLTDESLKTIPTMIETIKRRGAITISVSGHTDAVGSIQINDKLAYERAVSIYELLLQNGVDPKRVTVSSHGKGNPLIQTPDGVAEPRNRRVEVVIR